MLLLQHDAGGARAGRRSIGRRRTDQPLEHRRAQRGLDRGAAGDHRAELLRIAGEHGDPGAAERDQQQRIGRLGRLVDHHAVEHRAVLAVAEQEVIAAGAGRQHDVGAVDDRALGVGDLARGVAVERAGLGPALLRFGAALAGRRPAELARAVAPLAGQPRRAVGADLGVEREPDQRRVDPRGVAEPHRAQPSVGQRHPLAEVVDRGVRRRRAQHALAARDALAHDLDQRAGLAGARRAVDQREVARAQRGVDRGALALVERVVERGPARPARPAAAA